MATINEKVALWMRLRHEISTRKKELSELETPIKAALKKAPNRERQFGPHRLALTADSFRKNFKRDEAIKVLGEATLAPFFSDTPVEGYIQVK